MYIEFVLIYIGIGAAILLLAAVLTLQIILLKRTGKGGAKTSVPSGAVVCCVGCGKKYSAAEKSCPSCGRKRSF